MANLAHEFVSNVADGMLCEARFDHDHAGGVILEPPSSAERAPAWADAHILCLGRWADGFEVLTEFEVGFLDRNIYIEPTRRLDDMLLDISLEEAEARYVELKASAMTGLAADLDGVVRSVVLLGMIDNWNDASSVRHGDSRCHEVFNWMWSLDSPTARMAAVRRLPSLDGLGSQGLRDVVAAELAGVAEVPPMRTIEELQRHAATIRS